MKGKNIGDIFLPSMFLPKENRGGIHYSEHISLSLETMWIVVRTFLIGANVATPPLERHPQQLDVEQREEIIERLFWMLFGSIGDAFKSTEHKHYQYGAFG